MGIIDMLYDYCDDKIAEIDPDDPHGCAKAFGLGMIRGIPDGLSIVGATTLIVAVMNFLTGKGFRI